MAVKKTRMFFWVLHRVDMLVGTNVSEKHSVLTFKAEVKLETVCLPEMMLSTSKSARCEKPENQHQIITLLEISYTYSTEGKRSQARKNWYEQPVRMNPFRAARQATGYKPMGRRDI
jgi:hypothetical protein